MLRVYIEGDGHTMVLFVMIRIDLYIWVIWKRAHSIDWKFV